MQPSAPDNPMGCADRGGSAMPARAGPAATTHAPLSCPLPAPHAMHETESIAAPPQTRNPIRTASSHGHNRDSKEAMRLALPVFFLLALALLGGAGCNKSGCPTQCPSDARAKWESALDQKTELALDATRDITIK